MPKDLAGQVWLTVSQWYGNPWFFVAILAAELISLIFLLGSLAAGFGLFHLLAMGIQVYALRRQRGQPQVGWLLLGLVLGLHLPFFGCAGLLLCKTFAQPNQGPTALEELKSFVQMSGSLNARPGLTRVEQVRQALAIDSQLDAEVDEIVGVRSLVEGGVSERSQISQLKLFLSNPRSDAYHLAQAEVARLLEHYSIQLAEAGEQVRACPDEVEHQDHLAQWHLRFAECGLLEANLEEHYVEMALNRYLDLIRQQPSNMRWRRQAIEILLSRGRIADAISQCRSALLHEQEDPDIWLRLFEAHFQGARAGAVEPVRQLFQLIQSMRLLYPKNAKLRELIKFWTEPVC